MQNRRPTVSFRPKVYLTWLYKRWKGVFVIKIRQFRLALNSWSVLSIVFVILLLLPNLNILINVFKAPNENWIHIKRFLLQEYVTNTLLLVSFTGLFSVLCGISLAWLVAVYDFPLRSFLKWGLILPLAIPPYIAAYTYNGLLNYTGVIQTFLRNEFNIHLNQKYVDLMSVEGAIFIFTMFLFPYVYTITRDFLEKQSASLIENARVLGRSPMEIFLFVILPVSRAAIVGGASLVILEVLNDYGVVQYFGVTTFSTAIFKTWFGLGDVESSIKLSALLLLVVFGVLLLERVLRGRRKYSYTTAKVRPISRIRLKGAKAALASVYSFAIFGLGFLIPLLQLIHWAFLTYKNILSVDFGRLILNTLLTALLASAIIAVVALVIANYGRMNESFAGKICARLTVVGYSIPGAVIAIGVIVFFVALDNNLFWFYQLINPDSAKLVLSTSLAMLIFAYVIRFLAIGFNAVETGFEKVGKRFFEASRMLGMSVTETFFKIDVKMIRPAIVSGFILVLVDIMKELPLTLLLRPFNYDTLATKVYQYANDEMIREASIPSLIIIFISAVSIYFFNQVVDRGER